MDSFAEIGLFQHPRPKKTLLPLQQKKRKLTHKIEEISFDPISREEYLTGFHKRKLARIKLAQAEAEKKSRDEKIALRKKLKEERKKVLDEHMEVINNALQNLNDYSGGLYEDTEDWKAFCNGDNNTPRYSNSKNYEEDFVDDEKKTTVTIENMNVTKNGLIRSIDLEEDNTQENVPKVENLKGEKKKKIDKPKRKKFRYESKIERKLVISKQKSVKKRRQCIARKSKS